MQVASRVFLLNNTDICSFVQYNSNAQILLVFISWSKVLLFKVTKNRLLTYMDFYIFRANRSFITQRIARIFYSELT